MGEAYFALPRLILPPIPRLSIWGSLGAAMKEKNKIQFRNIEYEEPKNALTVALSYAR